LEGIRNKGRELLSKNLATRLNRRMFEVKGREKTQKGKKTYRPTRKKQNPIDTLPLKQQEETQKKKKAGEQTPLTNLQASGQARQNKTAYKKKVWKASRETYRWGHWS